MQLRKHAVPVTGGEQLAEQRACVLGHGWGLTQNDAACDQLMLSLQLVHQFPVRLKVVGHDDQGDVLPIRPRHMRGERQADGDVGRVSWFDGGCKDDDRCQRLEGLNLGKRD